MQNLNKDKLEHLRSLSATFDSKFIGPFGIRFGLDGLLGFIPFVGDFIGSGVSFYIIIHAALLGCSPSILTRMGLNVLIENVFDMVPVLGNFFDIYWKANNKNIHLLERHLIDPQKTKKYSRAYLLFICVIMISFLILVVYIGIKLLIMFFSWLTD